MCCFCNAITNRKKDMIKLIYICCFACSPNTTTSSPSIFSVTLHEAKTAVTQMSLTEMGIIINFMIPNWAEIYFHGVRFFWHQSCDSRNLYDILLYHFYFKQLFSIVSLPLTDLWQHYKYLLLPNQRSCHPPLTRIFFLISRF